MYIAEKSYEPTGPFGAKSVGELPVVAVAPAIVNAVAAATGKNITALPLSKSFVTGGSWKCHKNSARVSGSVRKMRAGRRATRRKGIGQRA